MKILVGYKFLLLTIFTLNEVTYGLRYLSPKLIKNLYLDLYNIKKSKNYNLEHIVPQCIYKDEIDLKKDMHNIILYPKKLNSKRSNYKYILKDDYLDYITILNKEGDSMKKCLIEDDCSISNNIMNTFVPHNRDKGEIARACIYFVNQYPKYKDIIYERIIDPKTLIIWNFRYLPTRFEHEKNRVIAQIQGNLNKYIVDPNKVLDDV